MALHADARGPLPAFTMAHGYAGTKYHGIARFAEAFAAVGFAVLLNLVVLSAQGLVASVLGRPMKEARFELSYPAQAFHGLEGPSIPLSLDLEWASLSVAFPYAVTTRYEK